MAPRKQSLTYAVVEDITVPPEQQQAHLIKVSPKGGDLSDSSSNRQRALKQALDDLVDNPDLKAKFPDGLSIDNLVFVTPTDSPETDTSATDDIEQPPLIRAAQEILRKVQLHVDYQNAVEASAPYSDILQAVHNGTWLTKEQLELATDKSLPKILVAAAKATSDYQKFWEQCEDLSHMILSVVVKRKVVSSGYRANPFLPTPPTVQSEEADNDRVVSTEDSSRQDELINDSLPSTSDGSSTLLPVDSASLEQASSVDEQVLVTSKK